MSEDRAAGSHVVEALRIDAGTAVALPASVVAETAIALTYNGVSHAVMMATPLDLEDFALGFSLSEGIVAAADEFRFIEALPRAGGLVVEIGIPQHRFEALQARQRRMLGGSACGLCGVESLEAAGRAVAIVGARAPVAVARIESALQQLAAMQALNRATGAAHAAAWCDAQGIVLREDVGRHCALDKLIGALVRDTRGGGDGFVLVSSRASYELVHKAATAGIGVLVAISAPTSAAIGLAERCGVCLIAFARGRQMNVYTHRTRLTGFTAS